MDEDRYNLEAEYRHDKQMEAFEAWFQGIDMFVEYMLDNPYECIEHEEVQKMFNEFEGEHLHSFIYALSDEIREIIYNEHFKYYKNWAYELWLDTI